MMYSCFIFIMLSTSSKRTTESMVYCNKNKIGMDLYQLVYTHPNFTERVFSRTVLNSNDQLCSLLTSKYSNIREVCCNNRSPTSLAHQLTSNIQWMCFLCENQTQMIYSDYLFTMLAISYLSSKQLRAATINLVYLWRVDWLQTVECFKNKQQIALVINMNTLLSLLSFDIIVAFLFIINTRISLLLLFYYKRVLKKNFI